MKYKAILFDMDGVLIQSEELMTKCGMLALKDFGVPACPEDFIPFVGRGEDRYIGGVAEKYGVPYDIAMKKRCYYYYSLYVAEEAALPDRILELLTTLKTEGYKMAVCTSADREKALDNLRAIGVEESLFDAFVTGEQITNKKPDPEIYLKGAELVGIPAEECLVVEDAPSGIQAAHAGGMKAVGVASSFSRDYLEMEAGPETIIDELIELLNILEIHKDK